MFFRMVYKSGQIFLPFCHNTRVWQTDRRTDRQTEFSSQYRVCITCSAVKSVCVRYVGPEVVLISVSQPQRATSLHCKTTHTGLMYRVVCI